MNTKPLTALHLFVIFGHVIWPNASQKLDVLITVKFDHLLLGGFVWTLKANHGKKNPTTEHALKLHQTNTKTQENDGQVLASVDRQSSRLDCNFQICLSSLIQFTGGVPKPSYPSTNSYNKNQTVPAVVRCPPEKAPCWRWPQPGTTVTRSQHKDATLMVPFSVTHSAASACYSPTCCQDGCYAETWYNHHCGIWSFLHRLLFAAAAKATPQWLGWSARALVNLVIGQVLKRFFFKML